MSFAKSDRVQSLRGASKREVSKEVLVRDLHKQREERIAKRRREAAAEKIQSAWKGRQTRLELTDQLLKEWLSRFGPFVADSQKALTMLELFGDVLPPVLFSVLPPYSEALRRLVHEGTGLSRRHLGHVAAVRGALALILRSLTSSENTFSYLHASLDPELQSDWLKQCYKLLLLCCGVIGSEELWQDGLLQAAAMRTLCQLTDSASWKPRALPDSHCGILLKRLSQVPSLYTALQRVMEWTERKSRPQSSAAVSGVPTGLHETEALLRVTAQSIETLCGDSGFESSHLGCFLNSALKTERLWERLAAIVPSTTFHNLQRRLSIYVGSLLDALEGMTELSHDVRCRILANVSQLAAGYICQGPMGYHPSRAVFVSWDVIGSCISLQDYLQKSLSVLNQCILSASEEGQKQTDRHLMVFAEPAHVIHLIACIQQHNGAGIELLAELYLTLLHRVCCGDKVRALPYCNVIAFADDVFPLLWNWISDQLHVPCSAPHDTKQWTYPSLAAGLTGLTSSQRAVLALFCQAYAHLLLVLDDEDFHSWQLPLTLDHNRAIASVLCNLAFHSYYGRKAFAKTPSEEEGWLPIVDQYFPVLLRRLYERDNRRSFCPSALWLAPFHTYTSSDAKSTLVAPTVLQALLNRTSGGMEGVVSSATAHVLGLCNLLLTAPQCVPFESRVSIFRDLIKADKDRLLLNRPVGERGPDPFKVLPPDAMRHLGQLGSRLKGPLYVTIIDAFNIEEPGIDHGGLTIELIEEVIKSGVHPDAGLFERNPEGYLYCSHIAEQHPQGTSMLYFLGEMLGKALYEGLLIDVPLAPFFLLRLQERPLMFDDLATLDADLHRNLIQLKRYEGDASDFGLDFTVEAEIAGKRMSEELLPGGSDIPVTNQNKLQYVHLMADWHINKKVGRAVHAFGAGLAQLIPIPWLRLFNPQELNALLTGGEGQDISLEDLRRYTLYKSGYSDYSIVVRGFWRVVSGFSPAERAALLKFVTSCSRPPLGGFQHLQPPFTICKVEAPASPFAMLGGTDVEALPTASTCFNMLKLPNYRRAATLRKKLLLAITSNSGFGYS